MVTCCYIMQQKRTKRSRYYLQSGRKQIGIHVQRSSGRCVKINFATGGFINRFSAYAPQIGCPENEKDNFYRELKTTLRSGLEDETVVAEGDLNVHVHVHVGTCNKKYEKSL